MKLLPYLLAPLIWLYSCTWRIREYGPADVLARHVDRKGPSEPCIYSHWHGDELVLVPYYSFRRLAVLSSLSKDGSLMARTLELLNYQVFRGSSSRGGARGLIGLIKAVKNGSQAAMAVDGPKGPLHEVKEGIVELANRTGMPIVPLRCRASRAWYIPRAWNHSYVPKFFALVEVEYGEALPAGASPEEVKKAMDRLPGQPKRTPA